MSALLEKLVATNLIAPERHITDARNYRELGIMPTDIEELKEVILNFEEDEEEEVSYLDVHAWRALYQLAPSTATLDFLLECSVTPKYEHHDWINEDLIYIIQEIGEPAIKLLDDFFSIDLSDLARLSAIEGLYLITEKHPELKEKVVEVLVKHLQNYKKHDEGINGFLISGLLKNEAALTNIDLIRAAFAAGKVDKFCNGDLEDIEVKLGLRPAKPKEVYKFDNLQPRHSYMDNGIEPIKGRILPDISTKEREKRDAKKKLAKKAKKANRKK
jgi:hypothetical protein